MSFLKKRVFGLRLSTWGLMPLLVWGCFNLFFSTSLGTRILCDKIEQKIGLPCQLESVTWSPWMGLIVSEFRAFAPAELRQGSALLTVREIRVDVSWFSLLKGKRRWERFEVNELDVNVAVETLRVILAKLIGRASNSPLVEQQADLSEVPAPNSESQPADQNVEEFPVVPKNAPVEVKDENTTSIPVEDFEGVIILSNAKVSIFSERVPSLSLTLEQIEGEIPLWGDSRGGEISCERVGISEGISEAGLKIPLVWADRSLSVMEHSFKIFGLDIELSAAVKLASGFPAGLEISLPDQEVDLSSILQKQKSPIAVSKLTSRNRLQGYLLAPSSFTGSSITQFESVVIKDPRDDGEIRFDRGKASFVATGGGLVAREVHAIGEEDAILVNGFATIGGEAAATVRIVSSPERAKSHAKRVRMTSGNLLMAFQPLVTPDRSFRDIRIEARNGTLMMDLGEGRSWVPVFATAEAILERPQIDYPNLP